MALLLARRPGRLQHARNGEQGIYRVHIALHNLCREFVEMWGTRGVLQVRGLPVERNNISYFRCRRRHVSFFREKTPPVCSVWLADASELSVSSNITWL